MKIIIAILLLNLLVGCVTKGQDWIDPKGTWNGKTYIPLPK